MVDFNHRVFELSGDMPEEYKEERKLVRRLREAVSVCKEFTGIHFNNDQMSGMLPQHRILMERCLTQKYLLTKGMDYFGKRDLIYMDMRGQEHVDSMYTTDYTPP